jgi:hypothetical protein
MRNEFSRIRKSFEKMKKDEFKHNYYDTKETTEKSYFNPPEKDWRQYIHQELYRIILDNYEYYIVYWDHSIPIREKVPRWITESGFKKDSKMIQMCIDAAIVPHPCDELIYTIDFQN